MREREADKPKPDKWAVRPRTIYYAGPETPLEDQRICLGIVKAVALGEMTLDEADEALAQILGDHVLPKV